MLSLLFFAGSAQAAYSTGFASGSIQVTAPSTSGMNCDGSLLVEGRSTLDKVWLCLRGPEGELATYPIKVDEGQFSLDLQLRFGPGLYTIWMGESSARFDGTIRFEAVNKQRGDTRYLSPSAYVDSDNPLIQALARQITGGSHTDYEKLAAIHYWVAANIKYDYKAYLNGSDLMVTASQTAQDKSGICRNYAFLMAALCRAAGLPARVVYGDASATGEWAAQKHAWNEVYVGNRWVTADSTWDAGYIKNSRFISKPSTKYFNPDSAVFAATHSGATYTLH